MDNEGDWICIEICFKGNLSLEEAAQLFRSYTVTNGVPEGIEIDEYVSALEYKQLIHFAYIEHKDDLGRGRSNSEPSITWKSKHSGVTELSWILPWSLRSCCHWKEVEWMKQIERWYHYQKQFIRVGFLPKCLKVPDKPHFTEILWSSFNCCIIIILMCHFIAILYFMSVYKYVGVLSPL